jgi:hypothetical protein
MTATIVDLAVVRRQLQTPQPCAPEPAKPEPDYRQQFLDMFVPVGSLPNKRRYARPNKR